MYSKAPLKVSVHLPFKGAAAVSRVPNGSQASPALEAYQHVE